MSGQRLHWGQVPQTNIICEEAHFGVGGPQISFLIYPLCDESSHRTPLLGPQWTVGAHVWRNRAMPSVLVDSFEQGHLEAEAWLSRWLGEDTR